MTENLFDRCVNTLEERPIPTILNDQNQVAGYGDTESAVRYHAAEPLYSAVWLINNADEKQRTYSPTHTHTYPELNILVGSPGELVYKIQLGDEEREIESPATIVVPPGVPHSANIVRGMGAFVVVRLIPEQILRSHEIGESVE